MKHSAKQIIATAVAKRSENSATTRCGPVRLFTQMIQAGALSLALAMFVMGAPTAYGDGPANESSSPSSEDSRLSRPDANGHCPQGTVPVQGYYGASGTTCVPGAKPAPTHRDECLYELVYPIALLSLFATVPAGVPWLSGAIGLGGGIVCYYVSRVG